MIVDTVMNTYINNHAQKRRCRSIGIKIGTKCNLACKGCLDTVLARQPDIDAILRRLSNFDLSCCESISFAGGEPLLYTNEIKQIYAFIRSRSHQNVKIDFYTNGILIDKLKELSADIPNLQVTVSVNMPETYPNVNQYNNLLKNLKAYSRKYIHGMALTLFTVYPFEMLEEYFDKLKQHTDLNVLVVNVNKLKTADNIDDWFDMLKNIARISKQFHFTLDGEVFLPLKNSINNERGLCAAYNKNYICIGPDGNFLLCAYIPKTFRTLEEYIIAKDQQLIQFQEECQTCSIYEYCIGKCILDKGLEYQLKLKLVNYKGTVK